MKRRTISIVFGTLIAIALVGAALIPLHRERVRIRARIETMRGALRSNDITGVAAFVIPELRADYQTQKGLEHYLIHVGTDNSIPSIWISGDSATITPHPKRHFCILPGGNALEMAKRDGEWYFTGKLFID